MHRAVRFLLSAAPLGLAATLVLGAAPAWAKKPKKDTHAAGGATAAPKSQHPAPRKKQPKKPARPHRGDGPATTRLGHGGVRPRANIALLLRAAPAAVSTDLPAVVPGGSCPEDMAIVDQRLCVDRYEGTLVEVSPEGTETPWSPYEMPVEGHSYKAVSGAGVFPQAYISGAQADAACRLAGKRLCNPVEWRKACMGSQSTTFGYGAERQAGRCNDNGRSPMLHFYPQVNESWRLVGMTEMNDPRLNQWDGTLTKTGDHAECTNDYGVFDMVGNLHEWTSDPNGTFQGGYYLDTSQNGDGCTYRTTAHEFTYHDYSTGFRCCASVLPPEQQQDADDPLAQ